MFRVFDAHKDDSFGFVRIKMAYHFSCSTKATMYCRSSGAVAMNLMPIPNTALSSMSQLSDHDNLAITGMDFAPGGLRTMVKPCCSSGSMGDNIQAPSTLISFVFPVYRILEGFDESIPINKDPRMESCFDIHTCLS